MTAALDGSAFDGSALDGNAIGGLLAEVFGHDMTAVLGTCAGCGATAPMAEGVVYVAVPGVVLRCRHCGAILLVVAAHHDRRCVDLAGLARIDS